MPLKGEGSPNDPGFWERFYQEGGDRWELRAPTPPLVRAIAAISPGERALVLGCGRGHEARLVAASGWRSVTAVDFAPSAIAESRRLSTGGPHTDRIEWRLADLFSLPDREAGQFDLVLEHCCFCAIDPARRPEWRDVVHRSLRPGGLLLALFYTHGQPGGPPFTTDRDEVQRLLLEGFEIEHYEVPPDSIERRRGLELLLKARRT